MPKDYYNILELNRNCTQEEISQAFRRLALKFHPKRNSNKDFAINNHYFNNISEAYEVLSDRKYTLQNFIYSNFFSIYQYYYN